jgi:hypothetical protein
MRLVNRKEFLSMPAGTLFCKFNSPNFEELQVLVSSSGSNDFIASSFHDAIDTRQHGNYTDAAFALEESGKIEMDFTDCTRDGLYEDDQMFAVWERADVVKLIERLKEALVDGYTNAKKDVPAMFKFTREHWIRLGTKADSGVIEISQLLLERASSLYIDISNCGDGSYSALSEAIADKLEQLPA